STACWRPSTATSSEGRAVRRGVLIDHRRASRMIAFAAVLALLASAAAAQAEVRTTSFKSAALGTDVGCVVHLPPSYASGLTTYPVVYALHGLFERAAFWDRRGLSSILDDLWAKKAIPEFVLVAVDGGNSFFVNSPLG